MLSVKILTYEYDHLSRKTKFKYSLNGVEKTIATYSYDAIGRLQIKFYAPSNAIASNQTGLWTNTGTWQGGSIPTISDNVTINSGHTVTIPNGQSVSAGSLFDGGTLQNFGTLQLGNLIPSTSTGILQTLDYKYHIRGGLRGINTDSNNNLTNSIFSYKLDYEDDGTYFDGNIRKQSWKSNIDNQKRDFTYTYDGASRLKSGIYSSTQTNENYSLNNVDYDFNGNITQLSRKGWKPNNTFVLVDSLKYTYNTNSNKIQKVDDLSNETTSFKDVAGDDYDYWQDGSLKKDNNKEITQIDYNYLKLPERINLTGGRWIEYEYDSEGTKLKKTLSTGKYTDYEEDEIYEDGVLYQTSHDEGRIIDGVYEYNITDHLGNLRVAFKDSSGIAKITQVNAYGAFGDDLSTLKYLNTPKINNFGYLNHEFQIETGYTDLKNRQFDNIIGRFTTQDPVTDEQEHLSLYQYGWNNPISKSDPNGLMPCCGDPIYGIKILQDIVNNFEKILSYTDANDATVLATTITRGENAINVDGTKATTSDKVIAGVGIMIPVVSGSALKKIGGAIVESVIDVVKGGEKATETVKLRHYTSNKGLEGIKNDMEIKAFDQNTVFAEKAKGKPLSASDASEKYGIPKSSARNYIEFNVPINDVNIIDNPLTKAREYTIKGNVTLDKNAKFVKRK